MQRISLIAAVDQQGGLGNDNQLLCHLPADLQHFKQLTLGKPIIMGRKTFESIGKALPGRRNIIISSHFKDEQLEVAPSLQCALDLVPNVDEVMIIGGASIYQQALSYSNTIYLTVIEHQFVADVFFPQLDMHRWRCRSKTFRQRDDKNSYDLTFYQYEAVTSAL